MYSIFVNERKTCLLYVIVLYVVHIVFEELKVSNGGMHTKNKETILCVFGLPAQKQLSKF